MKNILPILLSVIFSNSLLAQDTVEYCQKNARMFSNCYTFVREKPSAKSGVFYQTIFSDDSQIWYGKGTFSTTQNSYILTFQPLILNHIEQYPNNSNDYFTIQLFGLMDKECYFKVRFADTVKNPQIFDSYWEPCMLKLPNNLISQDSLTIYNGFNKPLISCKINPGDSIIAYANNPNQIHILKKQKEVLKIVREGFIGEAIWTNEKRTLFVSSKNR